MTIDETKELFFRSLNERFASCRNMESFKHIMIATHPHRLMDSLVFGADQVTNYYGIKNYHQTYSAMQYTIDRAANYSDSLITHWDRLYDIILAPERGEIAGKLLKFLKLLPMGDFIGKTAGHMSAVMKGDDLAYHMAEANKSLFNVAVYDFDTRITPCLIEEFGY